MTKTPAALSLPLLPLFGLFGLFGLGVAACSAEAQSESAFAVMPVPEPDAAGFVAPIVGADSGTENDGSPGNDAGSCTPTYVGAESKTLDLLILLDKSSSLEGGKWAAAVSSLTAFVGDARSSGLRVGLQLFPRPIDATPACSFGAYAQLRVPFALLPAGASALQSVFQSETPSGNTTPTYPALAGALLAASNEVAARPLTDVAAVLLVTDGEPLGPAPLCGGVDPTNLGAIASLADAAFRATPSVRTFVIGLPGVTQATIDRVASAGGTTAGFLVDGSQVQSGLVSALSSVRNAAIPCEYGLPADVLAGRVSLAFVNVSYEVRPGAARELIPQTTDCSGGGWTYNSASLATAIVICPSTCDRLRLSPEGRVDVALGCATSIR